MLADDLQSTLLSALMVVGHFENEQVFKHVSMIHDVARSLHANRCENSRDARNALAKKYHTILDGRALGSHGDILAAATAEYDARLAGPMSQHVVRHAFFCFSPSLCALAAARRPARAGSARLVRGHGHLVAR